MQPMLIQNVKLSLSRFWNWKENWIEIFSGPGGIRIHDFRFTIPLLYELR